MTWLMLLYKQDILFSVPRMRHRSVAANRRSVPRNEQCAWPDLQLQLLLCNLCCLWRTELSWTERLERKGHFRQWFCHGVLDSMSNGRKECNFHVDYQHAPKRSTSLHFSAWTECSFVLHFTGIISIRLQIFKLLQLIFHNLPFPLSTQPYKQVFFCYYQLFVDLYMRSPIATIYLVL